MARWLSRLAFVAGVGTAAMLLLGWRVSDAPGAARMDLRVVVNLTGELQVQPVGTILDAPKMEARTGRSTAAGTVTVRNQTASGLTVSPRMRPADHTIDRALRIRVAAGRNVLYRGSLGGLRRGGRAFDLKPGQRRRLRVTVRVARAAHGTFLPDESTLLLELPSRVRS